MILIHLNLQGKRILFDFILCSFKALIQLFQVRQNQSNIALAEKHRQTPWQICICVYIYRYIYIDRYRYIYISRLELLNVTLWHLSPHVNGEKQKYAFVLYWSQDESTSEGLLKVCGKSCPVPENHAVQQQCWKQGLNAIHGIYRWRSAESMDWSSLHYIWPHMAVSTVGLQTFWETTAVQGRKLTLSWCGSCGFRLHLAWKISIRLTTGEKQYPLLPSSQMQGRQCTVQHGVVQLGQSPAPCCCLPALLAFSKPSSQAELGCSPLPWPHGCCGCLSWSESQQHQPASLMGLGMLLTLPGALWDGNEFPSHVCCLCPWWTQSPYSLALSGQEQEGEATWDMGDLKGLHDAVLTMAGDRAGGPFLIFAFSVLESNVSCGPKHDPDVFLVSVRGWNIYSSLSWHVDLFALLLKM